MVSRVIDAFMILHTTFFYVGGFLLRKIRSDSEQMNYCQRMVGHVDYISLDIILLNVRLYHFRVISHVLPSSSHFYTSL